MSDFKERLQAEYQELGEKTGKLKSFVEGNPAFVEIDTVQQDLLIIQLHAMQTYLTCLKARIARL